MKPPSYEEWRRQQDALDRFWFMMLGMALMTAGLLGLRYGGVLP